MGALEFEPATLAAPDSEHSVEAASLVDLADRILNQRAGLRGVLSSDDSREAVNDILRVGTSAGGARAKAILAWNPQTNEFRSGQVDVGSGFERWIMKFDGVSSGSDSEMTAPKGYGKIEYAYHLMALKAGVQMTSCRLHRGRECQNQLELHCPLFPRLRSRFLNQTDPLVNRNRRIKRRPRYGLPERIPVGAFR
jgi:serine/threonine-protein kinase HipA